MEILNTGYKISYAQPTPWLLKLLADLGLVLGLIVEAAPEFPHRDWVVFGVLAFKLLSTFIAEHPKPKPDES